jgi:predicted peptidase
MRLLRTLCLTFSILACSLGFAPDQPTGFLNKVYKNADGTESKYVLFIPHDYTGAKETPLILFLHGSGESGKDGLLQAGQGIGNAIKKQEKTFPFIVVFPQANELKSAVVPRWHAESKDGKRALSILDETVKAYKVDEKRIYLSGLSMGGYGTWNIAAAHPEKWAAIVPICGGGNPKDAEKIKDIPCWCFHGDKDTAVKVEKSREMIEALKAVGGKPKYTEYPGVGHNSWDEAYGTKELFTWLLEQKRK